MKSLILLTGLLCCAFGWVYVPLSSRDLVSSSSTILVGTILSSSNVEAGNSIWTEYQVNVSSWIKGRNIFPRQDGLLSFSVPGGFQASSNLSLHVSGTPSIVIGEKTVLFLRLVTRSNDVRYHLNEFAQGFFDLILSNGTYIAIRQYELPRMGDFSSVPVRRARDFIDWIGGVVAGSNDPEPPRVNLRLDSLLNDLFNHRQRFNAMADANGMNIRWKQFDTGLSINWQRDPAGQPNINGGGLTELQQAFATWNNNANTPVSYVLSGTTTSVNGLSSPDSVNSVVYEDPANYIPGAYNCQSGGTLAVGGFWYGSATHTFRGITWKTIMEGDMIMQNGISCYFNAYSNPSATYSNVLAHELGHTLGLGHSCGDSATGSCVSNSDPDRAIMRAYARPNGGVTLGADDHKGIEFLYSSCYPNCPSTSTSSTSTRSTTGTSSTTRASTSSTSSTTRSSTSSTSSTTGRSSTSSTTGRSSGLLSGILSGKR